MAYELILVEQPRPNICRITLNRPDKRNPLSNALRGELFDALEHADRDRDIAVIIIRGAGTSFSAGYDLKTDVHEGQPWHTAGGLGNWPRHVVEGCFRMWDLSKPLIAQFGNWPEISSYLKQQELFKARLENIRKDFGNQNQFSTALYAIERLPQVYQTASIRAGLDSIALALSLNPALQQAASPEFEALKQAYQQIFLKQSRWKLYLLAIHWHGFNNRYHRWLIGILKGDFGKSLKDGRPVSTKIREAVNWTLTLNITAILLAYLLSVPIGVYSAVHQGSKADRVISMILFGLDSMPNFWMASLLIIFFTTPDYGMDFFRVLGPLSLPSDAGFWERLLSALAEIILPVFCLTYGALAYISRQVRASTITALQQDYIRTARAKGLPTRQVVWKHAFRNALFPLITMFASVFPAALAGSVVIEHIFNIPGMGQLMIKSIQGDDWPVIYTILMLASLLTMIGILIADLLYAIADPRVDLNNKNRN